MIITRYHNMERLRLTVEFLTPTFLGGADQHAELRAAPFKNLLRQWWRVAVGRQRADHASLLKAEGELFGSVLDDNQASASNVRLEIVPTDSTGRMTTAHFVPASNVRLEIVPTDGFGIKQDALDLHKTFHPEVGDHGMRVENALYLGFGPITLVRGQTQIKKYIAPNSKAKLALSFPKSERDTMINILQLIDTLGAIGSRCRNGWGSLALSGEGFTRQDVRVFDTMPVANLIGGKAYPSALGADDRGPLCWESNPQDDWKKAMALLAETYLTLRTEINIKPQGLQQRHILGYPVTNHNMENWGGRNGRMPSQLRLLVKRNQANRLIARILHLPHKLSKPWQTHLGTELSVWQKEVHERLDRNSAFHRCGRIK